jgi:transcription elongation factor GreB
VSRRAGFRELLHGYAALEAATVGRWRAAEKPGSKYATPAGAARLRAELDELWRVERPRVTEAVSAAAAQGDRSENAEYTYGKKRLREIDRRVRHLRKRLEGLTVVDRPPADRAKVYFGAWLELETESGELREVRVVGPDEFDMDPRYVSMDSPLGRALLGKALDAEFAVEAPGGAARYTIISIRYESGAADS